MPDRPPLHLTDSARERVAGRFRALGEPMRLKILEVLFASPSSVGDVLDAVGGTQANVSKHLATLFGEGLVDRRKDGTRTVYSIADPTLKRICAIVCDAVQRDARQQAAKVAGTHRR